MDSNDIALRMEQVTQEYGSLPTNINNIEVVAVSETDYMVVLSQEITVIEQFAMLWNGKNDTKLELHGKGYYRSNDYKVALLHKDNIIVLMTPAGYTTFTEAEFKSYIS